jgi:hypothetical protein
MRCDRHSSCNEARVYALECIVLRINLHSCLISHDGVVRCCRKEDALEYSLHVAVRRAHVLHVVV